MAIQDTYLETTVRETIGQYVRVSKSRKLRHLTAQNEARIVALVKRDKRVQHELQELLAKRDGYVNRVNKLLNDLVEKHGDGAVASSAGSSAGRAGPTSAQSSEQPAADLDPRHICTRFHAARYLNGLPAAVQETLQDAIERHVLFQEYHEGKRREMVRDPSYSDADLAARLREFDDEVAARQDRLHEENVQWLRKWNVPFFCLAPGWEYPGLDADKAYLLDLMTQKFYHAKSAA